MKSHLEEKESARPTTIELLERLANLPKDQDNLEELRGIIESTLIILYKFNENFLSPNTSNLNETINLYKSKQEKFIGTDKEIETKIQYFHASVKKVQKELIEDHEKINKLFKELVIDKESFELLYMTDRGALNYKNIFQKKLESYLKKIHGIEKRENTIFEFIKDLRIFVLTQTEEKKEKLKEVEEFSISIEKRIDTTHTTLELSKMEKDGTRPTLFGHPLVENYFRAPTTPSKKRKEAPEETKDLADSPPRKKRG